MRYTQGLLFVVLLLTLCLGFSSSSEAQGLVVVPNALTDTDGGDGGVFPILCSFPPSSRYQQIFAAEQFAFRGTIQAMKFRLSRTGNTNGLGQVTIPDVLIAMTVTQTEPEDPSETFTENLGPVVQKVFEGDLTIDVPTCTTNPCPFDIMVPLEVPFDYNPSDGNLLVDWTMNICLSSQGRLFDTTTTADTPTTVMERIFTGPGSDVNAPTGTIGTNTSGDEIGLITQFVFDGPRFVPTLSQWGLIATAAALGIVGFIVVRRRTASAGG